MSALSPAELSAIRDAIEDELLPDTCTILSVTEVNNGMGGITETWGTASTNVACRLDMKQGREQVIGDGLKPYTMYMLSLPYDTVISSNNRILHNGITFAVIAPNNSQSWIGVKRVDLEVINA